MWTSNSVGNSAMIRPVYPLPLSYSAFGNRVQFDANIKQPYAYLKIITLYYKAVVKNGRRLWGRWGGTVMIADE